ncbi:restriction endonuclease subunit S [Kandleria vitulina]|uniref:restriction endonuclease subunit S n=1 Tax=Kandleria vitulina TaxID=1630 RepID=UPI00048CDDBD|nr:restriction endonuclease subunit S [Kandleria vitulina]
MSNIPNIRFKGFTDAWEQRKLGDMVSFSKGSGYSKGDLKENGTPIILYGRLYTKYETVISEVDTFADEKKGSVFSKGGEVIVPASGETAEDISIASVVEKSGILLGGDLNIITPPDEMDSAFLAISISNGKPHNDMAKMAQGKSVVHLHNSDLEKIDLPYPNYDEQRRISGFFFDLDNLITLHQRKCEQMKTLKKYMLQKMFPKNGQSVPEIRFDGFTDAWEQRKLGELSFSFEYGLNAAAKEYDGENKYIRITDIDDESHEFKQDDLTSPDTDLSVVDNYKLSEGDILFARTGASVGKSYIYKASDGLVYYAGFLIRARIKEENNPEFVYQNTLTNNYEKFIKVTSMRSGQPGVNAQEYSQFEIMIPSKAEQDKIAYCFRNLDNLITLHQGECEKLKKLKKYMLQNMFPKKG